MVQSVQTINLDTAAVADEVIVNATVDGVSDTRRQTIADLATQLAGSGAIADRLGALDDITATGNQTWATWEAASAATWSAVGGSITITDPSTSTHTGLAGDEPVETIGLLNRGIYRVIVSPADATALVLTRVGDLPTVAAVEASLAAEVAAREAADTVLQDQIDDVVIGLPADADPSITIDTTLTSGWTPHRGIVSGVVQTDYFTFYGGPEPKRLGASYPQNEVVSGAIGVASTYGAGLLGVSMKHVGAGLDIWLYGVSDSIEINVDGRSIGRIGPASTGTAQGGGAASITLASAASATDGRYAGFWCTLTGGTGAGERRQIQSYVGATKLATVSPPWTVAPDATTTYRIGASRTGLATDGLTGALRVMHLRWASTRVRHIEIRSGTFWAVAVASTDTLEPAEPIGSLPILVVGDSFWEGQASPSDVPLLGEIMARELNYIFYNLGSGSTGFVSPSTRSGTSNRLNFRDRICPDNAWTITNNSATAGTYTLSMTVNGVTSTTAALAYNASIATIETALNGLSCVTTAGGNVAVVRGDFGCPKIIVGRGLGTSANLTIDLTSTTGVLTVAPWAGDVAANLPLDGSGNALPFVLLVPGSGNDSSLTDSAVQTSAVYIAQQIVTRFPTAIPIFTGVLGDAVIGNAGTIAASDLSRNAAIAAGAAYLPRLNGRVPFIDTYSAGLGGHKLLWGSGSVAAPTAGTTDVYKSVADAGHPTGAGAGYLASWMAARLREMIRGW